MPKYIAFLRAINVGGHTVKMDHLRRLFEMMGFTGVETFIASGNVIFESPHTDRPALERAIETALFDALGYRVATFLRTPAELAAIAAYQPFEPAELENPDSTLYISFVAQPPDVEAQQRLMAYSSDVDEFHVAGSEVYWLCRIRQSDSKFSGALLEKALGMEATMRNARTIQRLVAKYA